MISIYWYLRLFFWTFSFIEWYVYTKIMFMFIQGLLVKYLLNKIKLTIFSLFLNNPGALLITLIHQLFFYLRFVCDFCFIFIDFCFNILFLFAIFALFVDVDCIHVINMCVCNFFCKIFGRFLSVLVDLAFKVE